jgi:diguanylate cyclase (GGDEF)-like protein
MAQDLERVPSSVKASFRWPTALLALSLVTLMALATYGLLNDRSNMLEREGKSAANLADSVQVYVTEMLRQSLFSVEGVVADLAASGASDTESRLRALRGAMRYDPVSSVLGVYASGSTLMVDSQGNRLALPVLQVALDQARKAPQKQSLTVLPIIYSVELHDWFLPLQLQVQGTVPGTDAVFALVSARKLVGATASVRLVPGAYISVVTPEGQRLFQYYVDSQEVKANRDRVSATSQEYLRRGQRDTFQTYSTLTGENTLFGISISKRFPLAVSIGVRVEALHRAWLRRSLGQMLLILVTSISGIYYALRLLAASRKERAYVADLEYLASHDSLTGLFNRYALQQHLRAHMDQPEAEPMAVVLLGLNRFKEINETLGHHAGDIALREVAGRLQQRYGIAPGCAARLSGDELVIWASLEHGVAGLCADIAGVIAKGITVDGIVLELDASLGVSVFPDDGHTPADLLRCADIAMHAAKRELRPYERYVEALDRYTTDSLAMKSDISNALREGQMSLVYQPKVDLRSGALAGVEALSRWIHPTKGPISPAVFIPLVESTELIHPFTGHVLHEVFLQSRRWLDAGHRIPVSLNISANNLMDAGFVETVGRLLIQHQVAPNLIELEITESALMRNPETALRRLAELRALGVKLSIDDFGTGYASLSYLKKLPVDYLKIDKAFILGLASDDADKRIVRSTIQLAHGFDMTVVAEGVETQEVAEVLRSEGCDIAQGYFFARPLAPAALESEWLRAMQGAAQHH